MDCNLNSVNRACNAVGGIRTIVITPTDNVSNLSDGINTGEVVWDDVNQLFAIGFNRNTGGYRENPNINEHGQSWRQELKLFLGGAQYAIERLITKLKDRRVHAYYIDRNGFQRYLWDVRFMSEYGTGEAWGDRNGYTFTFFKDYTRDRINIAGTTSPPTGGDDDTPGDGTGGGDGGDEPPNPPPEGEDTCCLDVNLQQLSYIPSPTGNTENLNELVTASDGTIWIIDHNGKAMRLTITSGDIEITNPDRGYIHQDENGNRYRARIKSKGGWNVEEL